MAEAQAIETPTMSVVGTITIRLSGGKEVQHDAHLYGPVAVHRAIYEETWTVTHVASSGFIATWLTEDAAHDLARRLVTVPELALAQTTEELLALDEPQGWTIMAAIRGHIEAVRREHNL